MTRDEFFAMVKDLHEHPEHLAEYRKNYMNVYSFSDGIFKMLMANEAKPERTVKFLNVMLDLNGENAINSFTFGVPENPGVLNDKTAIFDIYGTTEAGTIPNSHEIAISFMKNWMFISWKWKSFLQLMIERSPNSGKQQIGRKCFEFSELFSKKRRFLQKN